MFSFSAARRMIAAAALVVPISAVITVNSWLRCRDGHTWQGATFTEPMSCSVCGYRVGDPLNVAYYTFLTDLRYNTKYGKLYYHFPDEATFRYSTDYSDYSLPGFVKTTMDARGNQYLSGIHMDGSRKEPYYIEYNLRGGYNFFSCWIAPSSICLTSNTTYGHEKYVDIYCDDVLAYRSARMTVDSKPEEVFLDVRNVQTLRFVYSETTGSNDLAVIYDPCLE